VNIKTKKMEDMRLKFNLCRCTNCETTLFDENPQVGAPKFELKGGEMDMVQREEDGESFWACPNCLTDGYLTDI